MCGGGGEGREREERGGESYLVLISALSTAERSSLVVLLSRSRRESDLLRAVRPFRAACRSSCMRREDNIHIRTPQFVTAAAVG